MAIERANSIDQAIARFGQLVGPLVAGMLIAAVGTANVLFIDAGTHGSMEDPPKMHVHLP